MITGEITGDYQFCLFHGLPHLLEKRCQCQLRTEALHICKNILNALLCLCTCVCVCALQHVYLMQIWLQIG